MMISLEQWQSVTVLMLTAFLVTSCGGGEEEAEERLRPVRYITVESNDGFRSRSFSGTSKSSTESRLSFKVAGTVTSVPVQNGQRLNAGDLIAEIDPATYELQAQQAQASLVEAQANDRRAAANYDRTKGLYANENSSLNDLEAARAEAEAAQAVVASAGKALEISRLNRSYTRLLADTDCSIASLDIEVNENVASGQQVAVVSCGDSFEVRSDLPESLIGSVTETTPVSVRFGAIPDHIFAGQISEIAVASSSGSAAFPVVITIVGTHSSLRSGLAADVTFQFSSDVTSSDVVILPIGVVINDPGGTFVFIAEPGEKSGEAVARRRKVSLGELSQEGVEVVAGLKPGDRVVTAGITVIRDGQRVLVPSKQ
jgi:multidrug efflux system membrane fusion protein